MHWKLLKASDALTKPLKSQQTSHFWVCPDDPKGGCKVDDDLLVISHPFGLFGNNNM
jgi:hypothetical protein